MIASVLALALASSAAAAPADTFALIGHAQLTVSPSAGAWTVCGSGSTATSTLAGAWVLQVAGTAGTPIPLAQRVVRAPSFADCVTVSRLGLPAGAIEASLTFHGAVTYVVAGSVGGAVWGPVIGDQPFTVDLQR